LQSPQPLAVEPSILLGKMIQPPPTWRTPAHEHASARSATRTADFEAEFDTEYDGYAFLSGCLDALGFDYYDVVSDE
jgi:hypothetical protein